MNQIPTQSKKELTQIDSDMQTEGIIKKTLNIHLPANAGRWLQDVTLICLVIVMSVDSGISASKLLPIDSYLGEGMLWEQPFSRPFVDSLKCVTLIYDKEIKLTKTPKAYIKSGKKKIAKAKSYEIKNHTHESDCRGILRIRFSGECPPKGQKYEFCLDSASICLIDDIDIKNSTVSYTLNIPYDLGEGSFYNRDEEKIESSKYGGFGCDWGFAVSRNGNPEWELFREDELIGKYPVRIGFDWNLGQANLRFDKDIYFDDGVRYRLILPAGSVCASREDITNKESFFEFIGGYKKPKRYPHGYCPRPGSIYDKERKTLTAKVFYLQKVKLVPGKTIGCTMLGSNDGRSWRVVPTLSLEGDRWMVTAEFHDVEMNEHDQYRLEIPNDLVVEDE